MAQKQITDTTPPITKQTKKPLPNIPAPIPTQKPIEIHKQIPTEIKILLEALEDFEGIAYAARNRIWQLYGPVDYQIQNSTKHRTLEDIRMSFPETIEEKLDFIEQDNKFIITAKHFLERETFSKVALAVRGMGGQYISAKKDSRFEIRKQ